MAAQKLKLDGDVYYPSKEILATSRVRDYQCLYDQSIEDREGFWEKEASKLTWFKKWSKVLDRSEKPFYKWFTRFLLLFFCIIFLSFLVLIVT